MDQFDSDSYWHKLPYNALWEVCLLVTINKMAAIFVT